MQLKLKTAGFGLLAGIYVAAAAVAGCTGEEPTATSRPATATSVPAAQPTATSAPAATATTAPAATATTAPAATATTMPTAAATATSLPASTATAAPAAASVEVNLNALNSSGQSGKATLTPQGDKTLVVVEVTPGGAGVSQPMHIHSGTCGAGLGGVDFPLTAVADGKSTTTLDVKLSEILSKVRAINVHKSPQEASVYTACGALPAAVAIDLLAQNNSGQSGKAVLVASGNQTLVLVDVSAGAAGTTQPMHIHSGTCGTGLGGVDFPLTGVAGGHSVSTVNAKLSDILSKGRAINIHKSPQEASVYTACGALPKPVSVTLGEQNASGQSGMAWLVGNSDSTVVIVEVTASAAATQPIHIHAGTCGAGLGSVEFPLTSVAGGRSVTHVNAKIADILSKPRAINVHKSPQEASVYTACGPLPSGEITVTLSELNGSGQSGKATLKADGDKTVVTVEASAGAAGVSQPMHIHSGTCGTGLGGVDYPLTALANGKSMTTLDIKLTDLLSKQRAVNVHKSPQEASVYTACGALPAPAGTTPAVTATTSPAATATQSTVAGETKNVSILNFQLPGIEAKVGDKVVWTNGDDAPHTVTSGKPGARTGDFDSGSLSKGATFAHVLTSAGLLDYYCEFHTDMQARIIVR